ACTATPIQTLYVETRTYFCFSSTVLSSFFLNVTVSTDIYSLSLHDALPIYRHRRLDAADPRARQQWLGCPVPRGEQPGVPARRRSEEHTSELQSLTNLVCRLLLEKKNFYTIQFLI